MAEAHQKDNQIFKPIDVTDTIEHLPDPIRTMWEIGQDAGPVLPGKGTTFRDIVLPNYFGNFGERDSAAVFSFDLAREVLSDTTRFSSDYWTETNERVQGRSLFCMDPPEHTRFRGLLQMGFIPRVIRQWDEEIIKPEVAAAFDAVKGVEKLDLVPDVNLRFPYKIICRILGFPTTDEAFVSDRITKMTRGVYDIDGALEAVAELRDYIYPHLESRRANPKDDFLSALIAAETDGSRLSDDEIVRFILHVYPAGMETTFRGVSNLVHLLLQNPEQFAQLKRDRALIPDAIDEMLRYEGPVSMFARLVTEDTELGGVNLKAGSMVYVMHAVANRDPTRWEEPHKFDITRSKLGNLGFGYGPHVCIGMHLARRESEVYIEHLLDEMPNLTWDPDLEEIPKIAGWTLRSALSLPVIRGA